MDLHKIINHPATVPTLTALAGVVNGGFFGYILGQRKAAAVVGDLLSELDHVHDAYVVEVDKNQAELPFEEAQYEVIPFDRSERKTFATAYSDIKEDPKSDMTKIMEATGSTEEEVRQALREVLEDDVIEEGDKILGVVERPYLEARLEAERAMDQYAPEPVVESVFDGSHPGWDWDAEKFNRGEVHPYVIHRDEFLGEEAELRQKSLTYFAGDDIMLDEDEKVVPNYQEITGDLKWGHGSYQEDMVYIRNPRLEAEYEITRTEDSYVQSRLGYQLEEEMEAEEIRHFRQPRRLRLED